MIAAIGFTLTVNVKTVPVQLPETGVIRYVAVWAVVLELIREPEMIVELVALSPLVKVPDTAGTAHLYRVPAGITPCIPFTGLIVKELPLQTTAVKLVIEADGLIFTVTENVLPMQLPEIGDMV